MTTDTNALMPCPFCGADAEYETTTDPAENCHCVGCQDCCFSLMSGPVGIGWYESRNEAAAAWNRRVVHGSAPAPVSDGGEQTRPSESGAMASNLAYIIASALAREDGHDSNDEHCGLFDVRWGGGTSPEPLGDAWSMDYIPKGERIASEIAKATAPQPTPVDLERMRADTARLDWIEQRSHEGYAPALVYDDDGRFAYSEDGELPVPVDGGFVSPVCIWTAVEPSAWRDSIREAIDAHTATSAKGAEGKS